MTQLTLSVRDAATDVPLPGVAVRVQTAEQPIIAFIDNARLWHPRDTSKPWDTAWAFVEFVRILNYAPGRRPNYYVWMNWRDRIEAAREPVTQGMMPGSVWYQTLRPEWSIVVEVWDPRDGVSAKARYKAGTPPDFRKDLRDTPDGTWVFREHISFGVGWIDDADPRSNEPEP